MLDMGVNLKTIHPNWTDTLRVNRLPSFDGQFGEDGSTYAGVRQSRLGVKGFTPDRARASCAPRSSSSCSAPASTKARPRSGCVTPMASWARSAPANTGVRSWTSTCSRTRSSTGDRPAWCSSATSRCAGCRFRATRRLTLAVERPGASGDAGVVADRIELQNVKGRSPMPDFTGEYRFGGVARLRRSGRPARPDEMGRHARRRVRPERQRRRAGASTSARTSNWAPARPFGCNWRHGEGIQNYMNDAPVDVGIVRGTSRGAADRRRADSDHRHGAVRRPQLELQVVDRGRLLAHGHRQCRGAG